MRQVFASAPNIHVFTLNLVHFSIERWKDFLKSLIIYEENTEKIKYLISVWKSDARLLIFASLISLSEIILFEK